MSDVQKKFRSIFEKLRGMEGLLSPPALAEILGFKVDTLQKRRSKKLRPDWIVLSQNRVAYDPCEIADWLESNLSSAPEDQEATPPDISAANSPSSSGYDTRTGRMRVLRGDE